MSKIGFNNSPRRNHLFNITFVELFVLSNKIFCDLIFTIKELPHLYQTGTSEGTRVNSMGGSISQVGCDSHSWVV